MNDPLRYMSRLTTSDRSGGELSSALSPLAVEPLDVPVADSSVPAAADDARFGDDRQHDTARVER